MWIVYWSAECFYSKNEALFVLLENNELFYKCSQKKTNFNLKFLIENPSLKIIKKKHKFYLT